MKSFHRVTQAVAAAWFVASIGLPTPARAGDWGATAQVGETVNANTNPQLESTSDGGNVGSTTTLSLQAIDQLPRMIWSTNANLALSGYWGPGTLDSFNGLHGGANTAVLGTSGLNIYSAAIGVSGLPASVSEVFDSGITNANTTTINYSGYGALTHQLNELNAIGLSVSGRSEFFTNNNGSPSSAPGTQGGLTPNTYLTTGQSWIRTLTPTTGVTVGASTGWYTANNAVSTDSVSESVTAQVHTQLSERLILTAGGGGDVVRTTVSSDSISTGSGSLDSTSTGFIANGALSYALANASWVSAFGSHNLAPSSLGSLQELTQVGLTASHQINEMSRLDFGGFFLDQAPVTSIQAVTGQNQKHQALTLSVGYGRNLGQYWDLHLAYNFTEQDNGGTGFFQLFNNKGSSDSHAVFLTIRRHFNLFGTPPSPAMFGSPASPDLFGSVASPDLFGSRASPDLFGSPPSFGSPASPEPGAG
jgi:hypothetical protein